MATTAEIEKRLEDLELEVSRLKTELHPALIPSDESGNNAWVRKIAGVFQGDPHYAEADRLGSEWRRAQVPDYDADKAAPT